MGVVKWRGSFNVISKSRKILLIIYVLKVVFFLLGWCVLGL